MSFDHLSPEEIQEQLITIKAADRTLGRKLLRDEVEEVIARLEAGGPESAARAVAEIGEDHSLDDDSFRQEYIARRLSGEANSIEPEETDQ